MDHTDAMENMREYVATNLQECCAEVIEWMSTTRLRDGKVRHAAQLIEDTGKSYAMSIVEAEVKFQAMQKVANES